MHTTINNIPFPRTTEEVNWDFYFGCENLTNLVSDTARPDIILTVDNVIDKAICRSGQRECSWSFPRFIKLEMKMIFLALIVQCCINFAPGQALVITRASHGRDAFKIPASICKHNGAQSGRDCKSFYAVDRAGDCSCMCPANNTTFAYHERRWSCVENQKLRRHLYRGCNFTASFTMENADRRLPTLAVGARRELSLWFIFWPFWTCTLDINSSWYLGCLGSKIFLRRYYNAAVRLFTLSRRNADAPYVLRVNKTIPGTNTFWGKIINLVIKCKVSQTTQRVQFDTSCLLFKLEGNTTCPVSNTTVTRSSTIHQTQTSSIVPSPASITASHMFTQASVIQQNVSGSIMSVTPSQTLAMKPTISNLSLNTSNSYSIFSTVSTYLGSQPNITEILPMTSATKSAITEFSPINSTTKPTKVSTKISPTASSNTLMLSVIITGVVCFICGVAVVLLCFWRRKRSGSLKQQKWPTLPEAASDTIRSEEIIWLERQPRNGSRNPILGSVEVAATNACNNEVITADSRNISDATDTISRPPDTPLHHASEGPDGTGTIMDRALSSNNEQTSECFRSDFDYEKPVLNEAHEVIASLSKGQEKEAVYENANFKRFTDAAARSDTLDNNDEYCYSYTTDLPFKDEKSRPHEDSNTQGLENPNAGYQALEDTPASANGYTPMEGVTELSGYLLLQKSTRSVYQPLRKITTEAPRGAFKRK